MRQEYEKKLSILQNEYDRLKKEHSVCPKKISDLEKEILRLLAIIESLKRRPKSASSSSYKDEVSEEEKLEVVQVLAVKAEDQQFEVVEERR